MPAKFTIEKMKIAELKEKAGILKKEILVIYFAFRHPQVGIFTKLMIAMALGYALSPVDFIPDFIPVIGYVDDLVVIPVLIYLAIRAIPETILEECRIMAAGKTIKLRDNWIAGALFILMWLILLFLLCRFVLKTLLFHVGTLS